MGDDRPIFGPDPYTGHSRVCNPTDARVKHLISIDGYPTREVRPRPRRIYAGLRKVSATFFEKSPDRFLLLCACPLRRAGVIDANICGSSFEPRRTAGSS